MQSNWWALRLPKLVFSKINCLGAQQIGHRSHPLSWAAFCCSFISLAASIPARRRFEAALTKASAWNRALPALTFVGSSRACSTASCSWASSTAACSTVFSTDGFFKLKIRGTLFGKETSVHFHLNNQISHHLLQQNVLWRIWECWVAL